MGGKEIGEGTVTALVSWLWPSEAFPASVFLHYCLLGSAADSRLERGKRGREGRKKQMEGQRDTQQEYTWGNSSLMPSVRLPHSGLISGLFGRCHHTVFGRKPVSLH